MNIFNSSKRTPHFQHAKTNNNEDPVKHDDHHLHPDSANIPIRRTSLRPPLSRSPSPALLDAATNVMDFIKDERFCHGRRGILHSRYPKGTSSASTSPDLDRYPNERNRFGHPSHEGNTKFYSRRPRRCRKGTTSASSSPCYPCDSHLNGRNQSSFESYEYDNNVLSGRSRTPSPNQRNGYLYHNGVIRHNGRKLPPTPKQPSKLQITFKSNMNFPKLDMSPSSLLGGQPILQMLPDAQNDKNLFFNPDKHLKYDFIERELYERERDVDSEFDFKSNPDQGSVQGPLSFEEALLLSRPIRSTSVVWNGFKTTVVGYSPQDSKLDEDEWC